MTGIFGVSRSAYYKWLKEGVSQRRAMADTELLSLIREIVEKHHRRYGSPRVWRELRTVYGKRVSLKRVARLMRENGLNAHVKRTFIRTTNSKHNYEVFENILNREFNVEYSGRKWVSDITYWRIQGGWLYLTVIIDLYDRQVIGWAISGGLQASETVICALEMAIKNRPPKDGLIFHSDRGVQYCAQTFRDILQEKCPTVRQSMSRKGNCWDNACAESFFKTLKRELETLDGRHSERLVRSSVFYFIEGYYNHIRIHSTLDYATPSMFYSGNVA
jgi:transposase InsO family protein